MTDSINSFIAQNVKTMADYNLAVKCLKAKFKLLTSQAAAQFHIGDRVKFTNKGGIPVTGTVIGVNTKTVSVDSDSYGKWRVSPSLLKAA